MFALQIYEDLVRYSSEGRHIRVGLVGAGFMGRGIVEVIEMTPGMTVSAVADIDIKRARASFGTADGFDVFEIETLDITFPAMGAMGFKVGLADDWTDYGINPIKFQMPAKILSHLPKKSQGLFWILTGQWVIRRRHHEPEGMPGIADDV